MAGMAAVQHCLEGYNATIFAYGQVRLPFRPVLSPSSAHAWLLLILATLLTLPMPCRRAAARRIQCRVRRPRCDGWTTVACLLAAASFPVSLTCCLRASARRSRTMRGCGTQSSVAFWRCGDAVQKCSDMHAWARKSAWWQVAVPHSFAATCGRRPSCAPHLAHVHRSTTRKLATCCSPTIAGCRSGTATSRAASMLTASLSAACSMQMVIRQQAKPQLPMLCCAHSCDPTHNLTDVMELVVQGSASRHVAATRMNERSSRSHSVFTVRKQLQSEVSAYTFSH